MAQYIDKDALLAEIERLFEKAGNSLGEYRNGAEHTLISIKDFLDTLEVKEVDLEHLEQEVKDFCYKFDDRKEAWYNMTPHDQNLMVSPTFANFAMQLAKHFFELGLSVSNSTKVTTPDIDDVLKENGVNPDSKEAKIIKESYFMAIEKLTQKGK